MSFNPPYDKIQGYDADGDASTVNPVQIGGKDGTGDVQAILTGTDGTVKVDGSGVTQPVSGTVTANIGTVATLATAANQTTANTSLASIDGKMSGSLATAANQSTANTSLASIDGKMSGSLATAANQSTANTSLASIDGKLPGTLSTYRSISLVATGVNIKSSAGAIHSYYIFNGAASTRYIKFYNKATAPTVGTDTPLMTIPLPAGAAANLSLDSGISFSSGIGIGATTGVADNDTAAPSANEVIVNIGYK